MQPKSRKRLKRDYVGKGPSIFWTEDQIGLYNNGEYEGFVYAMQVIRGVASPSIMNILNEHLNLLTVDHDKAVCKLNEGRAKLYRVEAKRKAKHASCA